MGHCDKFSPVVEQTLIFIHDQLAVMVDRNHPQLGADLLAQHLPGHDVGMMLHRRDDDLVAGLEKRPAVTLRHQIDRLGGAAHEDNLLIRPSIDEAAQFAARRLVGRRGALAQMVHAAVDIGILSPIIIGQSPR